MKILIIKTVPGQINIKSYNCQEIGLALALRKKGHIADVMCTSDNGYHHEEQVELMGESIKLYCMQAIKFLKNAWLKNCDRIFNDYDILHVSEYNQVYTRHLAKKYKDKIVVFHGPYYSAFNRRYNLMAKFFDLFFLKRYKKLNTSFITKSRLAENYLRQKGLDNVQSIGVGIATSFLFDNNIKSIEIANKLQNIKGIKLTYVGVIEERRNVLFLLEILSTLIKKQKKVVLALVGQYHNKTYKERFNKKVEELGLQNHIIYQEKIQQCDIPLLYKNSDVLLLPTRYDIYGMVLLEAMYFGLITISTMCGGAEMMITNGENGFVIDQYDADLWSNCVIEIIQSPEKKKLISENARKTIAQNFTWNALSEKFIYAYQSKLGIVE